ncbi:hypothetical protein KIF24_10440 [Micromonospora sp. Llam7]|uniref:hypothetical protein n=1 Tax=Micromonospora tarapacensis TaxID=2835305 RepID=UPI001C82A22F|nr:hypothetical protein [Micromonospora tarapacensis]MBX7266403.1 hypothetical protein [Micromonospora tarapacensis]
MSSRDVTAFDQRRAWHHLLLWLAGRVADDLLSEARAWLAEDRLTEVAQGVAFAVASSGILVRAEHATLIRERLAETGDDMGVMQYIDRTDVDVLPPFDFAPIAPDTLGTGGNGLPRVLDLSSVYPDGSGPDDVDRAARDAVAEVAAQGGIRGLWRAWRLPARQSPWPPPKRVFLALVDADGSLTAGAIDPPSLTLRLQTALTTAGEESPQVEVAEVTMDLPAYHRILLGGAALLWTSCPAPVVELARVFDHVDPATGPGFDPEHPLVEDPQERSRLVAYLDGGAMLLHTTAAMDDVVQRDRVGVVPMNFRTDGTWIWTDTVSYYLKRYGLAPDPALLAHIAGQDFRTPAPDAVALHRAMAVLQAPSPA